MMAWTSTMNSLNRWDHNSCDATDGDAPTVEERPFRAAFREQEIFGL